MVAIFSILVIFWIQGRAVCDELYPISVVEDIVQNQPEWSSDDYIEPLEGQSFDQEFLAPNSPQRDDLRDLDWMKNEIVIRYNFKKDNKKDMWSRQPNFKTDLGTRDFIDAAKRVEEFFKRNNNLELTETNRNFRTKASCLNLLYITAARYLFVTHVLYDLYNKITNGKFQLSPCSRTENKQIIIPGSAVCYPEPYGTASCTSDYDVGLIGIAAGSLTEAFNNYFQDIGGFGKPSELVFDTNVYAFTLEFSMPFLFSGLPGGLADNIARKEKTAKFKMQELASAYYKVFKYNPDFFNKMVQGARENMNSEVAKNSKLQLNAWLKIFSDLNNDVSMTGDGDHVKLRTDHNNKYQSFVKTMSVTKKYQPEFLGTVAMALIYAAEAYHTRGAIRHVVGGTQMKVLDTATELSTNDLWVSMIENWGETNKEYEHCRTEAVEVCFLKMSKYMWRMFHAMKLVRGAIPPQARPGLVHFGEAFADPEYAMRMWLDFKKQGKTAVTQHEHKVIQFLRQFNCDKATLGKPLPETCISKINDEVNEYNKKLAATVTDQPAKRPWRP
ncbi:uncharacterized protein LOC122952957 [Acropora millepora]|uniref:uncharacterized protein LOC122952957 n=1 Tax=Acropora millepora TaxID=45264 RepID=UPI001CF38908|nr:uncharacterized protein LOC122952957 [Acropora millepora]